MKTCPDCLAEIAAAASFCCHCGERVEGKPCGACGVRNWDAASLCRWCGTPFVATTARLSFQPFAVQARLLATILQRGRLLTQQIDLNREKIIIRTPGVFNLSRREEEIPWSKVAGFDYHSGIFWDRVTIETRGQSSSQIACLAKDDGVRIREVLRALEL